MGSESLENKYTRLVVLNSSFHECSADFFQSKIPEAVFLDLSVDQSSEWSAILPAHGENGQGATQSLLPGIPNHH